MKVAPVSADLLIKLAIGAAVLGVAWYAVRRTSAAIGELVPELPDVGGWLSDASTSLGVVAEDIGSGVVGLSQRWGVNHAIPPDQFPVLGNPWGITLTPEQQRIYDQRQPVGSGDLGSYIGSRITGDPHFSLGGWIYDLVNPSPPWATPPDVPIGYGAIDARRIDRELGY